MRQNSLKPIVVCIACALASGNALADRWADQVADSSGVINPGNALHAPDGQTASFDFQDTITLNFLDNICLSPPYSINTAYTTPLWESHIIGFPDVSAFDVGWSNQATFGSNDEDGAEMDAATCDGGNILSWADFGGVIGDRKVKGNEKTQNVSFKGVAYSVDNAYLGDGVETLAAQVGWLEVDYRNGVSCNFHPDNIYGFSQAYLSQDDQRLALFFDWAYECSNEDSGHAYLLLANAELSTFDLGGGESLYGIPADGTYYLPDAKGQGRTKFRGAICIDASDDAYDVDGGSNVAYDDGAEPIPICESWGADAGNGNSGNLQWGEINIGGEDILP